MTKASQPITFNLVDRQWIPCVLRSGRLEELSLADALAKAHEVREIHDGSPLVVAALHRLLLAVLHSALRGPKRLADWRAVWNAGTFDQPWLRDYLARWHGRFDLFDAKHPFLQVPGLPHEPVEPNKLAHELAAGNNATLFDHSTDDGTAAISPPVAARRLLAFLGYAMGGLTSRVPGEPSSATAAPLCRGVSVLVRGASLFETLALNLLVYDPLKAKPLPGTADDRPAWEAPPAATTGERLPLGWLDWLTWPSRRVLLVATLSEIDPVVEKVHVAGGTELPDGVSFREPWFALRRSSLGLAPLRFDPERAIWRESTAIFRVASDDEQPPRATEQLAELVHDGTITRDRAMAFDLLGLANDKAKVLLWRRERLALPLALLGNRAAVDDLRTALDEAQAVRDALWGALAHAAEVALSPESDGKGRKPQKADVSALVKSFQAEATYWGRLAIDFESFLPGLAGNRTGALSTWRKALRAAAEAGFERARTSLGSSACGLKAQALGEGRLAAGLRRALPTLFSPCEPDPVTPALSPAPGASS